MKYRDDVIHEVCQRDLQAFHKNGRTEQMKRLTTIDTPTRLHSPLECPSLDIDADTAYPCQRCNMMDHEYLMALYEQRCLEPDPVN